MPASILAKLESPHGEFLTDAESGVEVYHVRSEHVLIQAAGYLKYVLAADCASNVYFRGQSKIYQNLTPTLYRGQSTQKQKSGRDSALKKYLRESNEAILKGIPDYAREPLLQHYGIKTRWLDVVDNIWIALWFACNQPISIGKLGKYLCFQNRKSVPDSSKSNYAYIYMIRGGAIPVADAPGYFEGGGSSLIDLRIAAPSTFLRPHAQHGLLFTRASHNDHKNTDYSDFVSGILRIDLDDALAWLGTGGLLNTRALFPPPIFDFGYMQLLEAAPSGNELVGEIHVVCA